MRFVCSENALSDRFYIYKQDKIHSEMRETDKKKVSMCITCITRVVYALHTEPLGDVRYVIGLSVSQFLLSD